MATNNKILPQAQLGTYQLLPNEQVPDLVIEELTGLARMKFSFREWASPIGHFEVEGKMRADFTRYPGARDATVQVLGPEEGATTLSGKWQDRYLLSGQIASMQIEDAVASDLSSGVADSPEGTADGSSAGLAGNFTTAARLATSFDLLRSRGRLVSVVWGTVFRKGILLSFKQTWHRADYVEWEMTFEWSSKTDDQGVIKKLNNPEPQIAAIADDAAEKIIAIAMTAGEPPQPNLRDFPSSSGPTFDLGAGIAAAVSNYSRALASVHLYIDKVQDSVAFVAEQVARMQSIPQDFTNIVSDVDSAQKTAASIGRSIASSYEKLRDLPQSLDYDAGAHGLGATASVGEVVRASTPVGSAIQQLIWGHTIRHEAQRARLQLGTPIQQFNAATAVTIVGIYTARQGDDLRDVAFRYYGDPEGWKKIKDFNGLKTSALAIGQTLRIPPA